MKNLNNTSLVFSIGIALSFLIWGVLEKSYQEQKAVNYTEQHYASIFKPDSLSGVGYLDEMALEFREKSDIGVTRLFNIDHFFQGRIKEYEANNDRMSGLIQLMAAMVVLGLLMLFYHPDSLRLPVLSIDIPDTFLFIAIASGIAYLWIQFGLSLNAGIDSRLALIHLVKIKESTPEGLVSSTYSDVNLLYDKGIFDLWVSYYYPYLGTEYTKDSTIQCLSFVGHYLIYGTLLGVAHAVCLLLMGVFFSMKRNVFVVIIYGVFMALFIFSGLSFAKEFDHALLFMFWYWFVAACFILWWKLKGRYIAEELKKDVIE